MHSEAVHVYTRILRRLAELVGGRSAGRAAYNGDFATELVLDLARLDSSWRVLLDELEEVLDAHVGCGSR